MLSSGGERRQDPRQPPREHRLTGAGRPAQERRCVPRRPPPPAPAWRNAGPPRRRSPPPRLSASRPFVERVRPGDRLLAREEVHRLAQRPHPVDPDASDRRRLGRVSSGSSRRCKALAAARPRPSRERPLRRAAHHRARAPRPHPRPQAILRDNAPEAARIAEGYREVEGRALFAQVRGGEVDYDLLRRELVAAVRDRHPHPLPRLLHRRVGETHDRETRQTRAYINLDLDWQGVYPEQNTGCIARQTDTSLSTPVSYRTTCLLTLWTLTASGTPYDYKVTSFSGYEGYCYDPKASAIP